MLKSLIEKQEKEETSDIEEVGQNDYSGKRVLLVEDIDLNLEIAETLLEFIGIETETARDGQQAVDMRRQRKSGSPTGRTYRQYRSLP